MIALRSPYFVIVNNTNLTSADLVIRIYTGAQDTSMASPQYSLSGTAISETVTFDIAELCRDYIDSTFDGEYTCTAVYVNYQVTEYINSVAQTPASVVQLEGVDAYTDYWDGISSTSSTYTVPMLMQDNRTMYVNPDEPFNIPVYQGSTGFVTFYDKGREIASHSITATANNANIIQYKTVPLAGEGFKKRVDDDSGEYDTGSLEGIARGFELYNCDRAVIRSNPSGTVEIVEIVQVTERMYDPVKVTFVNKYGALQDMWFFKKSQVSSNVDASTYRRNIIASNTYSTTKHSDYVLRKNSRERVRLNSGLYHSDYSEVFRQLLLSEAVWIKMDGRTIPVTVATGSHTYQTSANDKKIEFGLEVEYAFDKLNNIR